MRNAFRWRIFRSGADEVVRIAGVVAATRRLAIHGGSVMQFVTLEDESGLVDIVLFPGTYAALRDPVTTPGPFLVTGRVEDTSVLVSAPRTIPATFTSLPRVCCHSMRGRTPTSTWK